MKTLSAIILASLLCWLPLPLNASTSTILGWNNLGMHCMDSDYAVFTVLPPYNTIEGQLIVGSKLVTNGAGYRVTYQAVADPSGSINVTAIGKGNFYTYTPWLYGAVPPDMGLAGWSMPGPSNVAQACVFESLNQPAGGIFTPVNWWRAEGIPLSPYDDAGQKNPYPLMRMIAWSGSQAIATNDVVLPVSDEMDCRACHGSGTQATAKPAAGWVWDGLPERDYRLNILRLHDERQFAQHATLYAGALAANNYNPAGLYRRVTVEGKPVLCALCHASEALGTSGYPGVQPLTASVHSFHAHVLDPVLNTTLDNALNRAACYRCHPGSTTRCLRGAMGSAIAADGSMEMQCQSCHGNMSAVGTPFPTRIGWFMEPNCQACHTGTATSNSGQIRYTSAFDNTGLMRVPADRTFATTANTPPTPFNLSLYRFSIGHGGLQCSACHGSTHAEFPSSHANDNIRNLGLQGHIGVMSECIACHTNSPSTVNGGPHGMHPVGQTWVNAHHNGLNEGPMPPQCATCHGATGNGTVLSRMQANRTLSAFGTQNLFRGAIIGCYTCHNGSGNGDQNPSVAPIVSAVATNTTNDKAVAVLLPVSGAGATPRLISQAANGSVGLNTNTHIATYFPNPGFVGIDQFTFAAYDGAKNSGLATGTVSVTQGQFSIGAVTQVPPTYPAAWPVAFTIVPIVTNNTAPVTYDWDFGDGSARGTSQYPAHAYALPGTYNWTVIASLSGTSVTNNGTILIGDPVQLSVSLAGNQVIITWPNTIADVLLEGSAVLGPSAQWAWVTTTLTTTPGLLSLTLPAAGNEYFRVRRAW